MATNRDRLIQTFLARNRRKTTGIDQGLPRGGRSPGFTKQGVPPAKPRKRRTTY